MQKELRPFISDQRRAEEDDNTKGNRHWRKWHVVVKHLDLNKKLRDSLALEKHL